jgi:LuxR family maltose regulon positive regulatory protein
LDYLAEEVLERQPASLRGSCWRLPCSTGCAGHSATRSPAAPTASSLLQAIEAANLFLTPLDEVRGWWRYHHLFADLLRARLQQQDPERVAELHRRATVWHHEHGHADDAVRHALAAADGMRAARLIEAYADESLMHSEAATLQRWLAALPPELAATRPRLLIAEERLAELAWQGGAKRARPHLPSRDHRGQRHRAVRASDPYDLSEVAGTPPVNAVRTTRSPTAVSDAKFLYSPQRLGRRVLFVVTRQSSHKTSGG